MELVLAYDVEARAYRLPAHLVAAFESMQAVLMTEFVVDEDEYYQVLEDLDATFGEYAVQ